MDERVLERIIMRCASAIRFSNMLLPAVGAVFTSALFWITLKALFGRVVGVLHLPLLCMAVSVSLLPLAVLLLPVATAYIIVRTNNAPPPLQTLFQQQWKNIVFLVGATILVILVELVLTIGVAVWCGFESIPVFGTALYILSSWMPTILILVMVLLFVAAALLLVNLSAVLSATSIPNTLSGKTEIFRRLRYGWLSRLKLFVLGIIPSAILFAVASSWSMKNVPQTVEFGAALFRIAAFSFIGAPLFLFCVHMAVEGDRYVQYLTNRRGP